MKFGLIGHPIAHSLSPALFKAGYDGRYPYHLIETDDFEDAYLRFQEEYDGINVTAPFKELAFAKADILSEDCRFIGATNLLIKSAEGVKAYNSDYLGVRLWLKQISDNSKIPHESQSSSSRSENGNSGSPVVLIAGCGGAGKAAAFAASSLGMHCILMNRDNNKAEALAISLKEAGHSAETGHLSDFAESFRRSQIVIYNIPTAIPEISELLTGTESIGPKHVLEANYKNPSFTQDIIESLQSKNPEIKFTGGKTWLLYQALTGYRLFTGENPDLEKMSAVI